MPFAKILIISSIINFTLTTAFAEPAEKYSYDVVPGSEAVDTRQLKNYQAKWNQLLPGENGLVESGTIFEEKLEINADNIKHIQTVKTPDDVTMTVTRDFGPANLQPEKFARKLENGPANAAKIVELARTDNQWIGSAILTGGITNPFEYTQATNSFDGSVAGLTLAALPLKVGYKASLPTVIQLQRATYQLNIHVAEQRVEKFGDKIEVPVWVVDTEWVNVDDGSVSPAGADKSGGSYLVAVAPTGSQPHIIEYANDSGVIRWIP